jgi:hypothetical protein
VASSVGTAVGLNEWIKRYFKINDRDKKLSLNFKSKISPVK